jgi:hypothetical protein
MLPIAKSTSSSKSTKGLSSLDDAKVALSEASASHTLAIVGIVLGVSGVFIGLLTLGVLHRHVRSSTITKSKVDVPTV